jgi:arsenate reductase (glutaredoxin)
VICFGAIIKRNLKIPASQNQQYQRCFMKKMYHLATCSTGNAIIKDTGVDKKGFDMQDIKTQKITAAQLDEMKKMAGSYEALFSRRALKYKELGLKDKQLTEKDYRNYILEEYTFLKRPVTIIGNKIFIGSEKKPVEALKEAVGGLK